MRSTLAAFFVAVFTLGACAAHSEESRSARMEMRAEVRLLVEGVLKAKRNPKISIALMNPDLLLVRPEITPISESSGIKLGTYEEMIAQGGREVALTADLREIVDALTEWRRFKIETQFAGPDLKRRVSIDPDLAASRTRARVTPELIDEHDESDERVHSLVSPDPTANGMPVPLLAVLRPLKNGAYRVAYSRRSGDFLAFPLDSETASARDKSLRAATNEFVRRDLPFIMKSLSKGAEPHPRTVMGRRFAKLLRRKSPRPRVGQGSPPAAQSSTIGKSSSSGTSVRDEY